MLCSIIQKQILYIMFATQNKRYNIYNYGNTEIQQKRNHEIGSYII